MDSEIHKRLQRVLNRMIFLEKKNIIRFDGLRLFPSELHVLELVSEGAEGSKNATRMAEQLGITTGAVSQTISRLERKGILTKDRDPTMKNELVPALTKTGRDAMRRFQEVRRRMHDKHAKLLRGFSKADKTAVLRFLTRLEQALEDVSGP